LGGHVGVNLDAGDVLGSEPMGQQHRVYPVPVPISRTRCPTEASSAASITATIAGLDAELVSIEPPNPGPSGCPSST
jgi:hypothetical protein